jgi:hypothetical protein
MFPEKLPEKPTLSPLRVSIAVTAMFAVWAFSPEIAHAAVAFGEIGQNIAENAKGVARGVAMGGFATGVGMGVFGAVDMYKAAHSQGGQTSQSKGMNKIMIGALLLGLSGILGAASATMFGSDQTTGYGELGL